MTPVEAFFNVMNAAMKDAAISRNLTQLMIQLDARGDGKMERVRIIVVPEKMDVQWNPDRPLGSEVKND